MRNKRAKALRRLCTKTAVENIDPKHHVEKDVVRRIVLQPTGMDEHGRPTGADPHELTQHFNAAPRRIYLAAKRSKTQEAR